MYISPPTYVYTTHRRSVPAGECQKQYDSLRAAYEASDELEWYRRSGQGEPNFFPGFCRKNPLFVYLHYIMREDNERTGSDDLSIAAFSLIDPKKHVNSMQLPAGAFTSTTKTIDVDDDVPSSDNQPPKRKRTTRQSFMNRLNRTLDSVMKEHYSPAKRERERPSIMDLLDKKVRAKKLRSQLSQLNEQDPDDDYERDDLLLIAELSSINNELSEVTDARQRNATNDHSRDSDSR